MTSATVTRSLYAIGGVDGGIDIGCFVPEGSGCESHSWDCIAMAGMVAGEVEKAGYKPGDRVRLGVGVRYSALLEHSHPDYNPNGHPAVEMGTVDGVLHSDSQFGHVFLPIGSDYVGARAATLAEKLACVVAEAMRKGYTTGDHIDLFVPLP